MRPRLLRYRAGPRARRLLEREGLAPGLVRAVVGPASGPKWLVLVGLDRALLDSGLLSAGRIVLAGASAGAWRIAPRRSRVRAVAGPRRAVLNRYRTHIF